MSESLLANPSDGGTADNLAEPSTHRQSYLSAEQAADYLNVTPAFIRRAASACRLRHFRIGKFIRFDPADLDAFACVEEPTTGPDPQLVTEVWSRSRRLGR